MSECCLWCILEAGDGGDGWPDHPGHAAGAQPHSRQEHAQVDFCFLGCQVTLLTTGQTVSVGPQDTVVIDDGVMTVNRQ